MIYECMGSASEIFSTLHDIFILCAVRVELLVASAMRCFVDSQIAPSAEDLLLQ